MTDVDLATLRLDRDSERDAPPPPSGPRQPRGARVALALFGAVVLAVAASFVVPLLRPVARVRTAPIVLDAAGAAAATQRRATAVEAAGWVEPDPFPTIVRPLVAGVLAELNVLEGAAVRGGETVIGRLDSAELLAARDRARAALALREAQVAEAEAALAVAQSLLGQKADERRAFASASFGRTIVAARLAAAQAALAQTAAERDARRAELEGQRLLAKSGGTFPVALERAEAEARAAENAVAARARDVEALEGEVAREDELAAIARDVLEDPRALAGAVATSRAALARSRAERDAAAVELSVAERELSWAEVRAPIDGVVMTLLAAPGSPVGHEGPDETGLVALYDPARLQARIDVPLDVVAAVAPGQEVEIRSDVIPDVVVHGVVDRVQRTSDLLKNTLQVKVRLVDPPPLLRPETLVRARFLAAAPAAPVPGPADGANGGGAVGEARTAVFRVPEAAVRDGAVYVLDPTGGGRARAVPVAVVGKRGDDALVTGALSATQRAILDAVDDGQRVRAEEER